MADERTKPGTGAGPDATGSDVTRGATGAVLPFDAAPETFPATGGENAGRRN